MTSIQNSYQLVHQAVSALPQNSPNVCENLVSLIFYSMNATAIAKAIDACKDTLNNQFTFLKLSPTHLAAIKGDHGAIEYLHSANANVDLPDLLGYTPLHHSAMKGDLKGVSTLLRLGAGPEHKNGIKGTYMDLLRFNAPFREQSDMPLDSKLFSAHVKDELKIDLKCLPPGVKYIQENVARPETLIAMWERRSKEVHDEGFKDPSNFFKEFLTKKYQEFKDSPPHLVIAPIVTNDAGKKVTTQGSFCGLFANDPIKKGAIIGEYVGEIIPNEYTKEDEPLIFYDNATSITSKNYPSAISATNNAFPNAFLDTKFKQCGTSGMDGLPLRMFIRALEDIAPGQEIAMNYGLDPVWWNKWRNQHQIVQLRPEAFREFLEENSWNKILHKSITVVEDRLLEKSITDKHYLETINSFEKFVSILPVTPRLTAFKEGLITGDDLEVILTYLDASKSQGAIALNNYVTAALDIGSIKLEVDKEEL